MATAVVVGTVIGSGVFKKPQLVAEKVPFVGLAGSVWVVSGLLILLGALAYAEVAVLFPRAGGNYVFLREAYGRLAGFLWGWVDFCIIRTASMAALATIFTESLNDILGNPALGLGPSYRLGFWSQQVMTVAILLGLALVNVRGVRWGGLLQLVVALVKVASLVAISSLPFLVLAGLLGPASASARPSTDNLRPTWPSAWNEVSVAALGTAYLGVFWAYHGWMTIAPVAGEVVRPQRNLPLALIGGMGIVTALYLGANLAYSLVIPRPEMAGLKNTTVAAEFGLRLLGPLGGVAASAAVMISVFGALNGLLLAGPRLLYAMGEDDLVPRSLAEVHPRYHTPAYAILAMGGWAALQIVAVALLTRAGLLEEGKSHFDVLTDFAMFGALTFETMAVLAIYVFRRRLPAADRPYRCPGYPVVPALYVLLPGFVLTNMFVSQPREALAALGFIALGAAVYAVLGLGRRRPAVPAVSVSP